MTRCDALATARSWRPVPGLGIRDVRKTPPTSTRAWPFLGDDDSDPYALHGWDGGAARAPVERPDLPTGDPGGWEAVVDAPDLMVPGARVQLVTDFGSADLYGDGTEAGDLDHAAWMKSRAVRFTVGG